MSDTLENAVAIIGMGGRFPGAESPERLWQNLCAGEESIRAIAEAELEDALTAEERRQGQYVAARALLDGVDRFDAGFFHFLPREAELTDPQQRVLLECAWEALEDAGYDPARVSGSVGVFAGSSINTYLLLNLASNARFREEFTRSYQVGSFAELTGNGQDFLSTRIAYKLDLRGPAMTVQSACSTALLAVAQAWQSLTSYQSDLALAGAASISFPQRRGYFYQEGGMVSPDGHCRPFDSAAAGTVFGSGAGMVLLKRAAEAIADGDHIYALVLGAAVNNDGAVKAGYAAPSARGQAEVVSMAHAVSGVEAASIGYVECHGTGTPLGDPIEVAALAEAFGSAPRSGACVLSSVKGNIGHLDVAAGMAGLMKAAYALERGTIPGTLHYREPNPRLALDRTPFILSGVSTSWPRGSEPRRAGVSAFGVGGTNVHLVLEEAPVVAAAPSPRSAQVLCLSARSAAALDAQAKRLAAHLAAAPETLPLADVAFTLATGRRAFPYRLAITAADRGQAIARLNDPAAIADRAPVGEQAPGVVLLFPGQGTQYAGMGAELYRTEPVYRETIEDCCRRLRALAGPDLLPMLYPGDGAPAAIDETRVAQPAVFVTSYALARLWMHWGVQPAALAGHSIGEIVAAALAGIFSLDDALQFVARRGEWMQTLPPGAMLAARLAPEALEELLPAEVSIAAINGPLLTVASGPVAGIEALAARLEQDRIACRRLNVSHAFHSGAVEPVVEPLRALLGRMRLRAPEIPVVSTVIGARLTVPEATSPEYWAAQCRLPVQFSAAVATLMGEGHGVYLEAGAGDTLLQLVRQHLPRGSARPALLASLSGSPALCSNNCRPDGEQMAAAAGALWTAGAALDWQAYYSSERRGRVSLPTYPFERQRYWVERTAHEAEVRAATRPDQPASESIASMPPKSGTSREFHPALENAMPSAAIAIPPVPAREPLLEPARRPVLEQEIAALFADLSGLDLTAADYELSFLELGFDSLFLTQAAQRLQAKYGVKIAFRQMLGELSSIGRLAGYLDSELPAPTPGFASPVAAPKGEGDGAPTTLIEQQLRATAQLIQSQLQMLNAGPAVLQPAGAEAQPGSNGGDHPLHRSPIEHGAATLTKQQKEFLSALIERTTRRTAASKAFTQQHRPALADPRVVSGFRPEWKEMVYSIVSSRSRGSKLWDIDGNEYIDLLNGFGPNLFGHSPEFVTRALAEQMEEGFAIGPQTPLAGRAAEILTAMTGTERVTFCNTGSEAVMAAMRIARTVTGRDRIVFFAGDYHGQFDEALVKQLRRKGEYSIQPAAPGIPRANLSNITVLVYGADESLRYIEQHAQQLAAVLVEPVQSRHPSLQPKEFLTRVREITRASGTALIFDEVVTGFRIHPRGAQGYFGIDADLVTYGKVVAGGMPIGILAGKAAFMDALDGGFWQFGDASVPEAGVTFFAGTFVRHPLAMAALTATLEHIQAAGQELYDTLNRRADRFTRELRDILSGVGSALSIENCGSVMYLGVAPEARFAGLLFYLLREKGVFLLEGFPMYLTTAHSEQDLEHVLGAFRESITELQSSGLLPGGMDGRSVTATVTDVPLTEPQMEIVLAAQISETASCAFNESFGVALDGPLDGRALETAWQALIARHDALRMSLSPAGDRLRFHPGRDLPFERVDLAALDVSAQQRQLEARIEAEGRTPFALVEGPLLRAALIELASERHMLLITAHHLVCDGWSVNVLVEELAELYSAAHAHREAKLPATLSFRSYALDRQTPAAAAAAGRDLAWWKQQLTPQPELLTLPTVGNRPDERSHSGATHIEEFPAELALSLRKTGAAAGCTLFTTLLAGWQVLLWRLSGNADPVTLVPSAAQAALEGQTLVGHCVHLLPIRAAIDPATAAASYMRALQPTVLAAHEHAGATYGSIVRQMEGPRQPGRLPLSEIQFNLEQVGGRASFAGLAAEVRANRKQAIHFDLFLNIVDTGKGLRLECDYNTTLYDPVTISLWLGCYRTLLEDMAANPARTVSTLSLIPAPVARQLAAANTTATPPQPVASIPELIARGFSAFPSQPAADFYGMELSRAQLAEQSSRLASWLLRNGAGPGTLVGIYMDRSLEMLVAMLAVLKAGAAYVPLDPLFPPARIEQIVAETRTPVMLTLGRNLDTLPNSNARVLALDLKAAVLAREPIVPLPAISPEARAYVIFTSGSTGRPKGVEVPHGAVVNLLTDLTRRLEMSPADRLLAITTFSFDIAVLEMLLPLVSGGTVALADRDDVADGARLLELVAAARVTALQATPVTWRMLLEQGFKARPGFKMFCGGEAWTPAIADRLLGMPGQPGGRLWNMYGPTETTVWSSVTEVHYGATRMTIGPPIANTRFYVLDPRLEPVPPGVPGELYIAGLGVARGYYERPELTAERFLADPFEAGERMYRTGDEVRQLPDGRIEFLGRLDSQIKLRGFRIELGEIETALRSLEGVTDAVAVLRPDANGEPILVGYYTGAGDASPAELREALRGRLPGYMIPTILKQIAAIPLTPNGKVDRRALPEARPPKAPAFEEFSSPRTPIEQALAEIAAEVLGCARVGARTSLLDLGADSLRIFQIASRAHRRGYPATAKQFLQLHTIEAVAAALERVAHQPATAHSAPLRRVSRESYRMSV